jgi:hypothetical protein
MAKYLDTDQNKLRKGFYVSELSNGIIYFTGKYDKCKNPIIESCENSVLKYSMQGGSGETLNKINKKEAEERLNKLKDKVN